MVCSFKRKVEVNFWRKASLVAHFVVLTLARNSEVGFVDLSSLERLYLASSSRGFNTCEQIEAVEEFFRCAATPGRVSLLLVQKLRAYALLSTASQRH